MTRFTPAYPAVALVLLPLLLLLGAPPVGDIAAGEGKPVPGGEKVAGSPMPVDLAGEPATSGLDPATRELRNQVEHLVEPTLRWNGEWGMLAVSLATGDTLLAVDPDRSLVPASNQKILTSAAALHHLGPDYRFSTFLLARGEIADGVLHGDLILYGTGDPTFADQPRRGVEAAFPHFLGALEEMGIREVRGDVLGDESYFQGPFRRPGWSSASLNDWYGAPVSALTFNENVATLRVQPTQAGSPPRASFIPEAASLPLDNQSLTVASRTPRPFMAIRDDPEVPIVLRGQLTEGSREVWRVITVSDPASYAASVFQGFLEEEGIPVRGSARAIRHRDKSVIGGGVQAAVRPGRSQGSQAMVRTVAVHRSPPLAELLRPVNMESHNLFAELLLFTLGKVVRGTGSFDEGVRVLEDYVASIAGASAEGIRLDDGSGLSRHNRLTASSLVRVLQHMVEADYGEPFWASLPTAGNHRELGRMYQSPAAGNLQAKTGTIRRVSSLSGIVRTADGEPVLFSILANQLPSSSAKRIEDQIGIGLAAFARSSGPEGPPASVESRVTASSAARQ